MLIELVPSPVMFWMVVATTILTGFVIVIVCLPPLLDGTYSSPLWTAVALAIAVPALVTALEHQRWDDASNILAILGVINAVVFLFGFLRAVFWMPESERRRYRRGYP